MGNVHPSIHPFSYPPMYSLMHPVYRNVLPKLNAFIFSSPCIDCDEINARWWPISPLFTQACMLFHPFIHLSSSHPFPSSGLPSLNELGQMVFCLLVVWLGWETECTSVCESFPSFCFWLLLLLSWAENVSLWANSKVFSHFTCHRHMLQSHPCLHLCTEECVTARLRCLVLHGWTRLLVGS